MQTNSDTGLIYMRHRYYDPVLRQFITEDPAQAGLNWYRYAGNDPINAWDPMGLDWEWNGNAWNEVEPIKGDAKPWWNGHEVGDRVDWSKPMLLPPKPKSWFQGWIFDYEQAREDIQWFNTDNDLYTGMRRREALVRSSCEAVIAYAGGKIIGAGLSKLKIPAQKAFGYIGGKLKHIPGHARNMYNYGKRATQGVGRWLDDAYQAMQRALRSNPQSGHAVIPGGSKLKARAEGDVNSVYNGVREASDYLIKKGVPREFRKTILESFDVRTMRVRKAGTHEFGIRYFDDINAFAKGRYLFETFPATRQGLALPPKWNLMRFFKQFQIKPGATMLEGSAAPQGVNYPGGQLQKYILNPSKELLP